MKILVIGGAGYVGSHTVRLLHQAGHQIWIYDNISRGHREAARGYQLIEGELEDRQKLVSVFREHGIEAVVHFAAFALVGE